VGVDELEEELDECTVVVSLLVLLFLLRVDLLDENKLSKPDAESLESVGASLVGLEVVGTTMEMGGTNVESIMALTVNSGSRRVCNIIPPIPNIVRA
jgi:hypothetical protein